ncbi:MAG: siroheme synthase CysG [Pseudomonadota bacterium]
MRTFPMFLTVAGRRIVILGGGEQAAQKCRLALKTEAEIIVAAPELEPELAELAATGRIIHHAGGVGPALFWNTALVFVATGCRGADTALHAVAKAAGAVVNVVDQPDLCDAITPSIVDRDPVVVAIGTEGTAPVLARQIKTRIEEMLEPRLGALAALAGRLRARVAERVAPTARRAFWKWVFDGSPRQSHARGAEDEAARAIKAAVEAGGAPGEAPGGFVSLVGAGPGARDLITLRGVQRLQEADVIFYDRLVGAEILELARRDAERVYVGKTPGAADWPQERINALMVSAAKRGQRVVRLKCGDPGIFARGAEEAEALDAAGIAWEIVPGVTAASAAAACSGAFLTRRGETEAVVLATGRLERGALAGKMAERLQPGTTLAIYMGVETADTTAQSLLAEGVDPASDVEVVANATTRDERRLTTSLAALPEAIRSAEISSPAIIMIKRPAAAQQIAPLLHETEVAA